jgi:hypothetical protein
VRPASHLARQRALLWLRACFPENGTKLLPPPPLSKGRGPSGNLSPLTREALRHNILVTLLRDIFHTSRSELKKRTAQHGGVWTSCPTGSLTVSVKGSPARIKIRAFGTKTAEFHVCTACGVVPVVTSRIGGRLYAVVSVNAFEKVEPALLRRAPEPSRARMNKRA